jgi:hypothetical protein
MLPIATHGNQPPLDQQDSLLPSSTRPICLIRADAEKRRDRAPCRPPDSGLVEPERILPDDVVDTESIVGPEALDVVVPKGVDPFPGDRQ